MLAPALGRVAAATLVLALFAVGCGGGGGGGAAPPPPPPPPPPAPSADSLEPLVGEPTFEQRQHFLLRTSFGPRPADHDAMQSFGLEAYVDSMLFVRDSAAEADADEEIRDPLQPKDYELVFWWSRLMVDTDTPFHEVLALFWHDQMAVSQRPLGFYGKHLYFAHMQKLRRMGGGNLRELFSALIEDAAVQVWLDGIDNAVGAPNENLAREFWELLSLGTDGGYTEFDIGGSARALTGYRLAEDSFGRDTVVFDPARHDTGQKSIFGQLGNWGPRDVVEMTLAHRPAAEFVCKSLFEHFCYEDPKPELIAELAAILRANDWELRPVLRTLLRSQAFFSDRSRAPRVKSPIEYLVGFMRTTGLSAPPLVINDWLASLGHQPTRPPTVAGWPEDLAWLTPQGMLERSNAIQSLLVYRQHQAGRGEDVEHLIAGLSAPDSHAVVAELVRLMRITASPDELAAWADYLDTHVDDDAALEPSAFDATILRHVDERVRGLLFLLSQHPSYQVK